MAYQLNSPVKLLLAREFEGAVAMAAGEVGRGPGTFLVDGCI